MATLSAGISVSWDSVPFEEVTDLQVQHGGGQPKGRTTAWTDEVGTVSVACLGTTNVSTAKYGDRKSLQISGGGVSLTATAIYEQVTAQPELNGVTRFAVTFRLLDG